MRVALVSYGTRGDVQPFVCLGRALADAGHAVEVTASLDGEGMVRAAGLLFRPLALDAQEMLGAEEARRMLADERMRAFFRWLEDAEKPFWERNRRGLIELSGDVDVIVCGVLMTARCAAVAEARGTPLVPVHLCPTAPSRSYVPTMLPQRSLGPANGIAHNLPMWTFYRSQREDLAQLHDELGLPPPRWRQWRHRFGPRKRRRFSPTARRCSRRPQGGRPTSFRPDLWSPGPSCEAGSVRSESPTSLTNGWRRPGAGLLRLRQHAGPGRGSDPGHDSYRLGGARCAGHRRCWLEQLGGGR